MAIPGIQKITGTIGAPVFPDAGMMLLVGSITDSDAVTGSSASNSTTTTGSVAAGATTVTLTSATGYATNGIFQIDTGALAECHKILSVATNTITLASGESFKYAHASGVATSTVVAPYTHSGTPSNSLPSFSVEENMNGADLQFSGCIMNKLGLKCTANAEAEMTLSIDAQQRQIPTPGVPAYPTDTPFGPTGVTLSIGGTQDTSVSTIDLSLDNGTKVYETLAGLTYPTAIVPIERKIDLKATVWLQTLSGGVSVGDYYDLLTAAPTSAVVLTLTQGTNSAAFTLPAAVLSKWPPKPKKSELVMLDLEFASLLNSAGNDISYSIVNGNYLAY